VDEVVHAYGDLCQSITELANENGYPISVDEFHTFNRCLDNAIADAVREYAYGRQQIVDGEAAALSQEHAFFVHELRNHLNTAMLAFSAVRTGKVAAGGATGDILERSLASLARLIDRSVRDVRLEYHGGIRIERVALAEFIDDALRAGRLAAESRGCTIVSEPVDPTLAIEIDRDLVYGALANLLGNASKFSGLGSEIALSAYAEADRILISVTDHCGGVSPAAEAALFAPFTQGSADRTGLGVGLAISRKSVEASGGTLTFRNVPGEGCIFTITLPRQLREAATTGPLASA
jgi:signal transduction histidine kinase